MIDDGFSAEAKKRWGSTDAYREFEIKTANDTEEITDAKTKGLMQIFSEFGVLRVRAVADPEVQSTVKKLRDFISANFYTCTDEILHGLAKMYSAGGEMTENIDKYGGAGTAVFSAAAIEYYCHR